ncbi:hypothetical protein GCM10009805_18510 [Leucobacter chromiireducens subsp. solipictus]
MPKQAYPGNMNTQRNRFFTASTAWMVGAIIVCGGIGTAIGIAMGLVGMGIGVGVAIGAVVGFIGGMPSGEAEGETESELSLPHE